MPAGDMWRRIMQGACRRACLQYFHLQGAGIFFDQRLQMVDHEPEAHGVIEEMWWVLMSGEGGGQVPRDAARIETALIESRAAKCRIGVQARTLHGSRRRCET